ncbi:hypothetical protein E1B28_001310 [Marasmius oreades]|nr:uncharacterized protein E1B28_001310 [Marasmius oreades]KAG7099460.1 hypothetical protein E1B28_001310 [Marasmius oreades]
MFRRCIEIIWPLSAQKITIEYLLECFSSLLQFLRGGGLEDDILTIGQYIMTSYRRALLATALKKKICTHFIQNHLSNWTVVISQVPTDLHRAIQLGGLESLFNLDVLRDNKLEHFFLDSLARLDPETVVPTLPVFFAFYIQTTRRFRGVLFSQTANRDSNKEFRAAGFRFLGSCQTILRQSSSRHLVWTCTASLLDVVVQENLWVGSKDDSNPILREIVNFALAELVLSEQDSQLVDPIIKSLSAVTRIDYIFIGPVLSDILSRLLLLQIPSPSTPSLLEMILEYHIKTRTMDSYITNLFRAVHSIQHSTDPSRCRDLHDISLSSCVLHPSHLTSLSRKVHDHSTPSQTVEIARFIIGSISELWDSYNLLDKDKHNRECHENNRQLHGDDSANLPLRRFLASIISISGRIAVAIISSLSLDSLPKSSRAEFISLLENFSKVLSNALLKLMTSALSTTPGDLEGDNVWSDEIVIVAALQMHHASALQNGLVHHDHFRPEIVSILNSKAYHLPELRLELVRQFLLNCLTSKSSELDGVLASVLDFPRDSLMALDDLRLLHMLTQRWLPILDARASEEHLEIFAHLFLMPRFTVGSEESTAMRMLISQCFSSAEFWELSNLRGILLGTIDRNTSPLDNDRDVLQEDIQRQLISVFDATLVFPVDYIPRSLKLALIYRAHRLDKLLCLRKGSLEPAAIQSVYTLRMLVNRLMTNLGPYEYPDAIQMLESLQENPTVSNSQELLFATLNLGETCLRAILKNSRQDPAKLDSVIHSCSLNLLDPVHIIRLKCFERFIVILQKEYNVNDFPQSVTFALQGLFDHLARTLEPRLQVFSVNVAIDSLSTQLLSLQVWHHFLILGRWLDVEDSTIPMMSPQLWKIISNLPPSLGSVNLWKDLCETVFALVTEETRWCTNNRHAHLELTLAMYVELSRWIERSFTVGDRSNIIRVLEDDLSSLIHDLPGEIFEHSLNLLVAALTKGPENDLRFILNVAIVLLQDPPRSTLLPTQLFTTACINAFNDRGSFHQGTTIVRLNVLRFLSQRCRDRPAALRLADLGGIWSLLTRILSRSDKHDPGTSIEIFTAICSICNALIRLRRDLVVFSLPHLTAVLQLLVMTMRTPRPNLGGKQTEVVSNTLPMWMNVRQPPGPEEAKSLARLLVSLSTKTAVKYYGSSTEYQKAESLAQPFSKHAAYVLKAYIQASNDPLCVIPSVIRRALTPGLYSLCNMMNEFNRDALMASITDVGEKAILKALWKEYEKQRYVGKG